MRRMSKSSFTLIEMLIVVVVIGILTGMVFKLISMAKRKQEKLVTISILERVAYVLSEFKAEYGQYPPSAYGMKYYYNNTNTDIPKVQEYFAGTPDAKIFEFGLVSYLVTRDRSGSSKNLTQWQPDENRDEGVKKRWFSYLDGLVSYGNIVTNNFTSGGSSGGESLQYNRFYDTINDAWGSELRYICEPPYQIYDLWSTGPTGDAADDLHKGGKWDE